MEFHFTLFIIIEIIILIVILIGNSFIIYLNVKNEFFKSRVFYLVTSQACADLLTALIVIPSEIILVRQKLKLKILQRFKVVQKRFPTKKYCVVKFL